MRGEVSDSQLLHLERAGLSAAQIAETVAHTALNIFRN